MEADNFKYRFTTQGSRPYQVEFQLVNGALAAKCSCPAGSNGAFCKHVAWTLLGDISKILEGNEDLPALLAAAQDSPLLEKAKKRKPEPPKIELPDYLMDLDDLARYMEKLLYGTAFQIKYQDELLQIYMRKTRKDGKPYKNPTLILSIAYEPFGFESVYNDQSGQWLPGERKKMAMPWRVDKTRYAYFENAARKFLAKLNTFQKPKNH